jgi:pimeloyl-ACP methyl ester carboxylesterase
MDENKIPLFLLWGKNDPWCVEANAHRIKDYYKDAELTLIESGHCPHDDTPELVLNELCRYLKV